jgi:hypothetical protein
MKSSGELAIHATGELTAKFLFKTTHTARVIPWKRISQ